MATSRDKLPLIRIIPMPPRTRHAPTGFYAGIMRARPGGKRTLKCELRKRNGMQASYTQRRSNTIVKAASP